MDAWVADTYSSCTLSSNVSESKKIRFLELAMLAAISRAFSILRRAKKPGLFMMALPIISAAFASPSARTIVDCLSCFAFSTSNEARCASCWAVVVVVVFVVFVLFWSVDTSVCVT